MSFSHTRSGFYIRPEELKEIKHSSIGDFSGNYYIPLPDEIKTPLYKSEFVIAKLELLEKSFLKRLKFLFTCR